MIQLYKKNKILISYGVFGLLSTLINIILFHILVRIFQMPFLVGNAIAWIFGLFFAFLTNKFFVFKSKLFTKKILLHEFITFFGCRASTGLLDMVLMFLFISKLHWNSLFSKIIVNTIVIVINYITGRFTFKKEGN